MSENIKTDSTDAIGEPVTACYAPDERPWWKRKLCRLFGHHPMLSELPEWAKDGIVIDTHINFSFLDRLQILLHGNVSVRTWTAVENAPGRAETSSHAMPARPRFLG